MEEALAQLEPGLVVQFLSAVAADPDTVRQVVADIPPAAAPVDDYVTNVDERRQLFSKIHQISQQRGIPTNATLSAFVMIAPLEKIRVFVDTLRDAEYLVLSGANGGALEAIRACTYLPSPCLTSINISLDFPKGRPAVVPAAPLLAAPSAILNESGTPSTAHNVTRDRVMPDILSNLSYYLDPKY